MEPARVDLDNRHGTIGLEVHVYAVEDHEYELERRTLGIWHGQHVLEIEPHTQVGEAGAERADEHSAFAADLVGERPIDEEGERVHPGADAEDGAEVVLGHEVAQCGLTDREVVAPHVKERVGEAQREPVEEPSYPKFLRVPRDFRGCCGMNRTHLSLLKLLAQV